MSYQAFIDNQPLNVLHSTIFPAPYNEQSTAEFIIITGTGKRELQINPNCSVFTVDIRPMSLGLKASVENDIIYIPLDTPANFTVEINKRSQLQGPEPLLVFYSPARIPDFDPADPNVLYFPRGVHTPSAINIDKDNTLIYLEEGAWVNGKLTVCDCKGFHMCGHGVFTSELYSLEAYRDTHMRCVDVINCQDVHIEDVTLADSMKWTLRVFGCDNVHIDNVKIIGWRGNSDGIDICGSRNVLVEHIFTRTWDDSFVVKAFDTGDVANVIFRDSVLWNDFARPIEVGVELRADRVHNVLFDNIDIIHSPTGYPVMGIHHGDRALVSDITFRNIRIEDTPGAQLFDIRITDSVWNEDDRKGRIENITFENIHLIGRPGLTCLPEKSRLQGFDDQSDIRNVTFRNISLLGRSVTSLDEANLLVMDHVSNVVIEGNPSLKPVGHVAANLTLPKPFALDSDGLYRGMVLMELTNTGSARVRCSPRLEIYPRNTAHYPRHTETLSLAPNANAALEFPIEFPAGRYVFRVQAEEPCVESAWLMITLPLRLSSRGVQCSFVNYYNDRLAQVHAAVQNDHLLLSSDLIAREDAHLIVYSAMPAEEFEGEVKFTVEETDFGEAPAVLLGKHGLELAPQLRCPAEITYVFKNEPRVREIRKNIVPMNPNGTCALSFNQLGLDAGVRQFWLEIETVLPETKSYRYPYTLFHSVRPGEIAHMFAHVEVAE